MNEPAPGGRRLYEDMSGLTSKSNFCKTLCLDEDMIYCPTDNYAGGVCCEEGEFCPAGKNDYDDRFYQSVVWCSNYNQDAPAPFKWVVCPNEETCGDGGRKFISPPLDGEVITRAVDKYTRSKLFLDGDVCSWVIRNPAGMGARDWMWVEIMEIHRTEVFVSKAYQYKYKERNAPKQVFKTTKFGMLRGLDYYVIGHAVSQFPAYFKIRTWIERHEEPEDKANTGIRLEPEDHDD